MRTASCSGYGMTLKQFTGDDAMPKDEQDAYQADQFDQALTGCDVVVIPAGVPRKPGMTRQDLFEVNASLNKGFADAVAKNCPNAFVAIISNPVNSTGEPANPGKHGFHSQGHLAATDGPRAPSDEGINEWPNDK